LTTDQSGQNRQTITQAYEFVLGRVGIDISSGRLWLDYLEMLKSGPGNLGGTSWQDMQKMDTLRKVYQRAVSIPHNATLEIWREYDKFEMGMNKVAVSLSMCWILRNTDSVTGTQASPREVTVLYDRTKRHQRSR
jgi:cleavage stimulation factor subunit 3